MDFLLEYAGFLARAVTVLVVIIIVLGVATSLRSRGNTKSGELTVNSLNDFYSDLKENIEYSVLDKAQLKALKKANKEKEKKEKKVPVDKKRIYVLDFDGDIRASAVENLRHEITALLSVAKPSDEVVLRLESGGGMVHSYGLAASQLARIRDAGIPLTVCVDMVAASGGYMMACIGNKILSAPFAALGSIGVVAQIPNIHRLLKKNDIDVEVLTAGDYKRTLTVMGENTEPARQKFLQELQTTHDLFKAFVARFRPQLDIDTVATGEVWLGTDAQRLALVDVLQTSDEYLSKYAEEADIYSLKYVQKKSLQERVGLTAGAALEHIADKGWERLQKRFWS
ncbi:protease SohB [Denitrificimonas sp. JX-1]|uniref:Protease SohB n=1 Tax=Denitrificimonas halotolerans TaxID=3098930 RepID=A0ABU5GSL2_9GAMM|nr:protease SohB [Denitrificimonas sp. JX-1]MDY7219597.1 protease SohB [Denitrificimonas sp. JX-1]